MLPWQDLFGIPVHWLVMLMSVIILLAVGSDYNLLLGSPVQGRDPRRIEDRHHSLHGRYGRRGASGGPVFAATLASMMGSKLIVLAQMGSTIASGLLVDTLIVRSLLMPLIATLLGRWFWWPQVV